MTRAERILLERGIRPASVFGGKFSRRPFWRLEKRALILNGLKDRVLRYVMERRCREGGYCFYKLEEPNGLDTYSALSVLNLLGVSFQDGKTVSYLQGMQNDDGSYDSVFMAHYALESLRLSGEEARHDPLPYILKHIQHDRLDAEKLPAEITSVYKRMAFLVDLYVRFKKNHDPLTEKNLRDFVLSFYNEDKGFGFRKSTLGETSRALMLLARLQYPIRELHAIDFIRQCETPACGFTDIPGTSLSYIEYIHAGAVAADITGYRIRYFDQCVDFIRNCQNRTGGFSRVMHGGIATLEDTFYAVQALKLLSAL